MFRSTLAIALLTPQLASAVDAPPAAPADSLLRNGRILVFSGNERHDRTDAPRFEQALAIRDGRIVFIGTNGQAEKLAGPDTDVIDLKGRMVMPGIVDGHFHGTRTSDCAMATTAGRYRRSSPSYRRASMVPTRPLTRGPTSAYTRHSSSATRSCPPEPR
ncbi:MAG TPA: hypothetical protein VFU80_05265 [Sphingomicrobium sp.]|nr:hypothetical protein [Sphingomicrobium sp.]